MRDNVTKARSNLGKRILGLIVLGIIGTYLFPPAAKAIEKLIGGGNLAPGLALLGCAVTGLLGAVIGWLFAPQLFDAGTVVAKGLSGAMENMTVAQATCALIGMFMGIVVALVLSLPFLALLPHGLWAALSALLCLLSSLIGFSFGVKRWSEIISFVRRDRSLSRSRAAKLVGPLIADKILDTNIIIDGRILDILATGFVEGAVVIPQFVLAELRHIADSQDPLRRSRGRRGLDILNKMQTTLEVPMEIDDSLMDGSDEVDVKLLKLAQQRGAAVVTNDFNLNKVASVTGVRVLNINDLVNALKPVLISGEECAVQIVKEGREPGQGVGYLDDGTMIVVDNARRLIGETVDVVVTNILQTAAGRMIFGRTKNTPLPTLVRPAPLVQADSLTGK